MSAAAAGGGIRIGRVSLPELVFGWDFFVVVV